MLKLITINTWKGDGHYRDRIEWLAEQLHTLQPDVLACQEVFQTQQADTGQYLADRLSMYHLFTPARFKPRRFAGRTVDSCSGLSVLARYPIERIDVLQLPTDERDGERIAQFCRMDADGSSILLINTHLTYLADGSALRHRQLQTILTHPALAEPYAAGFLCGDFNAELHTPEIQYLLNHPAVSVRSAYQAGGGAAPGFTMVDQTGEGRIDGRSIDYIFSLAATPAEHPTIAEACIVLNTPNAAGTYPSDHFGVWAQVGISGKTR